MPISVLGSLTGEAKNSYIGDVRSWCGVALEKACLFWIWRGSLVKKIVLGLTSLFALASIPVGFGPAGGLTFAATSLDCGTATAGCDLRISRLELNPLLKKMPELQISLLVGLQDELLLPPSIPLKDMYPDIGIAQYDFIDREIAFFQTTFKERFEKYLGRSSRYLPMVRKTMKGSYLPEDMAYLPLIESGFNPMAVSRAKATGLWQFMKMTAKRYGLRVDQWIDERHDPVKSTRAAMEYFQDLYGMFGSWPLSMASYNAGEGKIGRTLASTGATDYWELKALGRMPRETRDYVPKFMAATMIAKNPESYGFSVQYETPIPYDEVVISKQTPLLAISRATNVSLAELKTYNPELKRNATPPNYPNYLLKLPVGKKRVFLENLPKLVHFTKAESGSLKPERVSVGKKKLPSSRKKITTKPNYKPLGKSGKAH